MKPLDTINAVNTRPRTTGTPQGEVEQFIKKHGLTDLDKNPKAPVRDFSFIMRDTPPSKMTAKRKQAKREYKKALANVNKVKIIPKLSFKPSRNPAASKITRERRMPLAIELSRGVWIPAIKQTTSAARSMMQRQDMEVINQDLPLIKLQSINSGQHYFASIAVLAAVKKAQGSYGKASAIAHIEQGFMIYVDAWCVSRSVQSRVLNELKAKYGDIYRVIDMKNNTIGYCRLEPQL